MCCDRLRDSVSRSTKRRAGRRAGAPATSALFASSSLPASRRIRGGDQPQRCVLGGGVGARHRARCGAGRAGRHRSCIGFHDIAPRRRPGRQAFSSWAISGPSLHAIALPRVAGIFLSAALDHAVDAPLPAAPVAARRREKRRSAACTAALSGLPQIRCCFSSASSGLACAVAPCSLNSVRISSATARREPAAAASPSPFRPSSMRTRRAASPASIASHSLNTIVARHVQHRLVDALEAPACPACERARAFAFPGAPPAGCPRRGRR